MSEKMGDNVFEEKSPEFPDMYGHSKATRGVEGNANASHSPSKRYHDCQTLMSFSEVVQGMNEVANNINKTSPPQADQSMGAGADSNSCEVGNKSLEDQSEQAVGGRTNDTKMKAADKTQATRQSSRTMKDDRPILEKAMDKKAADNSSKAGKGIFSSSSSSNPIPILAPQIESITRVCGISLGKEESVKLANISLIQAKADACSAIERVKQKFIESSNNNTKSGETDRTCRPQRVMVESSENEIENGKDDRVIQAQRVMADKMGKDTNKHNPDSIQ